MPNKTIWVTKETERKIEELAEGNARNDSALIRKGINLLYAIKKSNNALDLVKSLEKAGLYFES